MKPTGALAAQVKHTPPDLSGMRPAPQQRQVQKTQVRTPNNARPSDEDRRSSWLKNVVDSAFRAVGRHAEASVDLISQSPFVRVPFRFATETLRNGTSSTVQRVLDNKKIDRSVWVRGAKKAVENATATAVFEPNRYKGSIARMGVGFLNMMIRLLSRVALIALDVLDPGSMDLEHVPDEVLSRTLGRVVRPFTSNPLVHLGARFGEQILINTGLEKLLVKTHLISRLKNEGQQNQGAPRKPQNTPKAIPQPAFV